VTGTDERDFDAFYAETRRRLVGQLYVILGNLGEAEDAVQEAYCRAWPRWSRLRHYGDPEAWIRTVAYRVAVSSWRKTANRLAAHRRHGPPDPAPDPGSGLVMFMASLHGLSTVQRQALVLHHLVGLSLDEIAAETHVSVGTVKSRLARARQALAAAMGRDEIQRGEAVQDVHNGG
jgi:RNA polymerase sigma-70 factor (ECF subfamily)